MLSFFLAVIVSYLIGSIPTAYLFGKFYKGIDIRQFGSGNIGATNAFRVLGKIAGSCVLMIDIVKGALAVSLIADIFGCKHIILRVILGIVVVSGHNWTCFLNFKGGKGIATSLGVLIGLAIKVAIIRPVLMGVVFIWLLTFFTTGFISLASIIAATLLPILMAITNQPFEMIGLGIIFAVFVVIRHQPNIKRLLAGQEPRVNLFGPKK